MTPEQQAEFARREQRKAYTTNVASNAVQSLIHEEPDLSANELASRAWDIAEAMQRERAERGYEH